MSDSTTLKATCFCGTANHEISLPSSSLPLKASLCSCTSCRHTTGTLALTGANLPSSYHPSDTLLENLTPFEFSPRLTFYHCTTCGTQMLVHCSSSNADPAKEAWDVFTGTLEKADSVLDFVLHEHIADTLDGGFADLLSSVGGREMQRWPHSPHVSEELPLYWTSPERPSVTTSEEDRLHCHCKCGGVEFWIAHPSERSKNAFSEWPDVLIPDHLNQRRADKTAWWLTDGGRKFLGGFCACNSCRLDSGCEWVEWAFVPTVDISLDKEGKEPYQLPFGAPFGWGTLKGYQSSTKAEREGEERNKGNVWRYHCGACGASVFFTCDEREDLIDVAVGLLDAPEGARAETWLDFAMGRLSFREDAMPRAKGITEAVEEGMSKFAARQKTA